MDTLLEHAWEEPAAVETYRTVGEASLALHFFLPREDAADARPAIVFFFGGGWTQGTPAQFFPHCAHLARRGMVAVSAEYRVASRHGVSPDACVEDARHAMRWVRGQASRFHIDAGRIAAGGGSAGGHLAACTALIAGDEKADVSPAPNALVLFNPVLDTTVMPGACARMGDRVRELSPFHHVAPGAPPCLIFHGTADTTVPIESIERFTHAMTAAGNDCRLAPFEGATHGFFNFDRANRRPTPHYLATLRRADAFLTELGYLPPAGTGGI